MEPTEANFTSLERKFGAEIAELRAELRLEQANAIASGEDALADELAEALRQSEELLEQLRRLRAISAEVQSAPGQYFTAEEVDALRYFGFNPSKLHYPPASTSAHFDAAASSPPPRPVGGTSRASPLPLRPSTSLSPERFAHTNRNGAAAAAAAVAAPAPSAAVAPAPAALSRHAPPIRVTATPQLADDVRSNASSAATSHVGTAAVPLLHRSESRHRPGHAPPQDAIHVPLVSPEKETDVGAGVTERFYRDRTADVGAAGSPRVGTRNGNNNNATTASPAALGLIERAVSDAVTRRLARTVPAAARSPDERGRVLREVESKIVRSDRFAAALEDALQHAAFVAGSRVSAQAAAGGSAPTSPNKRPRTQAEQDTLTALREDNLALQRQVASLKAREQRSTVESGFHVGATAVAPGGRSNAVTSPLKRQNTSSPHKQRIHSELHAIDMTTTTVVHPSRGAETDRLNGRIAEVEQLNQQLRDKLKGAAGAVGQLGAASPTRLGRAVAGLDRVLEQGHAAMRAAQFIRCPRAHYESAAAEGSEATRRFAEEVARCRGLPEWAGVLPFVVDPRRGIAHSITGISVTLTQPNELAQLLETAVADSPTQQGQQQQGHQVHPRSQQQTTEEEPAAENAAMLRVAAAAAAASAKSPSTGRHHAQQQQQQQQDRLSRSPSRSQQSQQQQQQLLHPAAAHGATSPHPIAPVPLSDDLSAITPPHRNLPEHRSVSEQNAALPYQQQQRQQHAGSDFMLSSVSGVSGARYSPLGNAGASPSVELATLRRLQEERDTLVALHKIQQHQSVGGVSTTRELLPPSLSSGGRVALVQPRVGASAGSPIGGAAAGSVAGSSQKSGPNNYGVRSRSPNVGAAAATPRTASATRRFLEGGVDFIQRNKSNISAASAALSSSQHAALETTHNYNALSRAANNNGAAASTTAGGPPPPPPAETILSRIGPEVLRTMTPAEIEVLKRVALTQQLREQKRRTEQQLANNYSTFRR